jgi:hypothetical protein
LSVEMSEERLEMARIQDICERLSS